MRSSDALNATIDTWHKDEARKAQWGRPHDIKAMYRSASFVADSRVVFNIGGNKYRLVTAVDYRRQALFVKFIGTHAEYDKINLERVRKLQFVGKLGPVNTMKMTATAAIILRDKAPRAPCTCRTSASCNAGLRKNGPVPSGCAPNTASRRYSSFI
ncbi:MAG: type II toxin-antitoxin system HigB family toxin [Thiogranum sp.]